ncbi:hypothetical protein V1478_011258 [Vespula squamosa]|uniref:Uncharacterized protein n=1 Tax=Vespula squamosa TaxID=30214 RepID=A0ABD2AE02_VESSQ
MEGDRKLKLLRPVFELVDYPVYAHITHYISSGIGLERRSYGIKTRVTSVDGKSCSCQEAAWAWLSTGLQAAARITASKRA